MLKDLELPMLNSEGGSV